MPAESITLFEILVRENADSLTVFLRSAIDDPSTVDDLFQETLLIAWRKIDEFDRSRPFAAWLRGIAKNLILAHYRTYSREIPFSNELVINLIDQKVAQIDRTPGDRFDDKIQTLLDCLEHLPEIYRQTIDLHYRENRASDWIAQKLEMTRDTVQKRLQRARLKLAECLSRKGLLTAPPQAS